MTELDDLKAKWEAHDLQLEKILRLNHELLSLAKLQPAESQLRRVGIYAGLEAAMWLVIVVDGCPRSCTLNRSAKFPDAQLRCLGVRDPGKSSAFGECPVNSAYTAA